MKLNIAAKSILFALITSAALFGCNQQGASGGKSDEQLKAQLTKDIPGLSKVDAVNKSPIAGINEVVVGRKVFYVTNDGKYLLFGNIIDTATKKSLTEQRTQELSKIDWNKLPLDLAIKEVNGNGKHKIAVFSDPDCPYCQMFEKQVASQLTDTTIYTFLFPLAMHPNAKPHANQIWCSKNRTATWTAWMRDKTPLPTDESCDLSALDKVYKIGSELVGVEGTPTIVLANGQVVPGMLPADQLLAQMSEAEGMKADNSSIAKDASKAK